MGWIFGRKKKKSSKKQEEEKLNPAQPVIARSEGNLQSVERRINYRLQYENLEIVNRGVNMIVDDASHIERNVSVERITTPIAKNLQREKVNKLVNTEPNPFQDINTFTRNLLVDLIVDGNIFIYFDGKYLYHLPADKVTIHSDENTYISHFDFASRINYYPSEIIHIKENSFYSIYRGISRLRAASRTMQLLTSMRSFQDNFFNNGAVPGLVLKSSSPLSEKVKERMLLSWQQRYNPKSGGKSPLILDGGIEIDEFSKTNFQELDFQNSVNQNEKTILEALGIPPILFEGGNNANIRPNLRLYYLETVLPIVKKINIALTRYFGFEITADLTDVEALQPELKDKSQYITSLANGGIITPNEAREMLGREKIEGGDDLRVPANIAGSAGDPSEGGRPPNGEENGQT